MNDVHNVRDKSDQPSSDVLLTVVEDNEEPPLPIGMLEASLNDDDNSNSKISSVISGLQECIVQSTPPVPFNSVDYADEVDDKAMKEKIAKDNNQKAPDEEVVNGSTKYNNNRKVLAVEEDIDDTRESARGTRENSNIEVQENLDQPSQPLPAIVSRPPPQSILIEEDDGVPILEATLVPDIPVYEATLVVESSEDNDDRRSFLRRLSSNATSEDVSSHRNSEIDDTARPIVSERELEAKRREDRSSTLNFSNIHIVGREQEIASLQAAVDDLRNKTDESILLSDNESVNRNSFGKGVVLIAGESGSGKSYLASTLNYHINKVGGLIVNGKFDQYFRDQPYTGISQTCSEICSFLLQLKSGDEVGVKKFERVRDRLKEEIGNEVQLLATVMPTLVEIVGEQQRRGSLTRSNDHGSGTNLEQARDRFIFAFRKFIRIITDDSTLLGGPLVMVLDDIQWADSASCELIKSMLTDRESSGLLVVGCYRSEEVNETHDLSKTILDLSQRAENENVFAITKMKLERLDVEDVNEIIMGLLSIDDAQVTSSLAKLCHQRTNGNPYYLLTFLRMLQTKGYLTFNVSTQWEYDVATIEKKTSATSNVVELVMSKLEQMPQQLQDMCYVAACLGSSFQFETLYLVWNGIRLTESSGITISRSQLESYLAKAIEEHVFEAAGDLMTSYHWSHDKVQEASMKLGETTSDVNVQFKVALILLEKYQSKELASSHVFVIANLLQHENLSSLNEKKRDAIARIYLEAAEKAVECSAFNSAAKYVHCSCKLLPVDAFENSYDLTLKVYSLGAEVESSVGNHLAAQTYYDEVIQHARTPLDKVRCYDVQLSELQHNSKMGCALCLDILEEFGVYKIPRSTALQLGKAMQILLKVNEAQLNSIDDLPFMSDPTHLALMRILTKLAANAYLSNDNILSLLATCFLYKSTLNHGLCPISTHALSGIAMTKCAMGNIKGGTLICEQTLNLLHKHDWKEAIPRIYLVSYGLIKPWTEPFSKSLDYLQLSYKVGLECGDTYNACACMAFFIIISIMADRNLNSVLADARTYLQQAVDLGRLDAAQPLQLYTQIILNLMGLSENPTILQGDSIDSLSDFECKMESKVDLDTLSFCKMFVLSVFGEHEDCAKQAFKLGDYYSQLPTPMFIIDTFNRGKFSLFFPLHRCLVLMAAYIV